MIKILSRILLACALLATVAAFAPAQVRPRAKARVARAIRWELLGEANVDGAVDHDRIIVTRADGTFRQIQLRVEKGPIEFIRVEIHYGDNMTENVPLRSRINAGGQSRAIDLPGGERIIRSVEFWYERARIAELRPRVMLYGN